MKNLWNINSDKISFETTTFNTNKYYIEDPTNSILYKIITYKDTNPKLSQYKNNIIGLDSYDYNGKKNSSLSINNDKNKILSLLTVDNIKLSSKRDKIPSRSAVALTISDPGVTVNSDFTCNFFSTACFAIEEALAISS